MGTGLSTEVAIYPPVVTELAAAGWPVAAANADERRGAVGSNLEPEAVAAGGLWRTVLGQENDLGRR